MLKIISLLLPLVAIAALLIVRRVRRFPPEMLCLAWPRPLVFAGWLAIWLVWMAFSELVGAGLGGEPPKPWHCSAGFALLRMAVLGFAGRAAGDMPRREAKMPPPHPKSRWPW